jgi:hypothetical protein
MQTALCWLLAYVQVPFEEQKVGDRFLQVVGRGAFELCTPSGFRFALSLGCRQCGYSKGTNTHLAVLDWTL